MWIEELRKSRIDKGREPWAVQVCCWMAQKGEGSSWWCAGTAEWLNSVVFPACHKSGQVSAQRIAAKVAIEIPEERCTFDGIGRWRLGWARFRCMVGGL